MYYVYVYLDIRKKGSYSYGEFHFEYEPFYVGKGTKERFLSHLRIAKGLRKGKNNLVISKIKSIISEGYEPQVIKIKDGITDHESKLLEIETITKIGKTQNGGPLLNTTDGGDGGITWIGDHHNKGKKLEEIVGIEKSIELKKNLSEIASKKIGDKNPMFGKKGELSPIYGKNNINYGKNRDIEITDKISNTLIKYYKNLSNDSKTKLLLKQKEGINKVTIEIKQEWYNNISKRLKEKYENGELFTDEHRQKLKETNYKKINKGSDKLKLSEDHKEKISNTLKNRIFSKEHRDKLRKCISFEEFEIIILNLIDIGINSITKYRKYAKENPELKYPIVPEKSYKNCGWIGWRKYGL